MLRLVLLGGGHAHLEVLRQIARQPLARAEVTLVTPRGYHWYSGMVPGFLRGTYAAGDGRVHVAGLARAAGARVVLAAAEGIDVARGVVATTAGAIGVDLLSCDVGSAPAGLDAVPGARAHATALRPIANAEHVGARLQELAARPNVAGEPAACVVGAGAAGVEVAFAIAGALRDAGHVTGGAPRVTLVDQAPAILPGFGERARRATERALARAEVRVETGVELTRVDADVVYGRRSGVSVVIPSRLTVWVAGAAAPAVIACSRLPRDAGGFLRVDRTLRAVDGAPVWGAGDCVALEGASWVPKAGVYAVREGPVLAHNLRAAVDGGLPRAYQPQRSFLALLSTDRGTAVVRWRGLGAEGRWAQALKESIDERFVRRYQAVAAR